MDLVPKPDQLVAAAGNAAHLLLHGGLADLRPMPRALVDEGTLREVHHYRPDPVVAQRGDPVLLVPPLAAPAGCFDLRRGCSLVEHLVGNGRPTYLVEYGDVSFHDPDLGLEHWAQEVVPAAVRAVSEHAGGRRVHVVGWSLGGIFAMLAAAAAADDDDDGGGLPVASLSVLGSPVDTTSVPMVAPLRPLLTAADWPAAVGRTSRALGGAPPLVRWAFQLGSFQRLVTKPIAVAVHLDDADWLAQVEAVDRFTASMTAYSGRSFGQLYHRFAQGNALATGTVELGDRPISLAAIAAPTLVFAGATDGIAPVESVRAALPLLTGAREARFEIVPGGHLGMLAGRAARETTWRALDEWFEQWDGRRRPTRRSPTKKATPKKRPQKAPAKKAPAKRAAPRKAPTEPTAAPEDASGTNPRRRHSSYGSRALRR